MLVLIVGIGSVINSGIIKKRILNPDNFRFSNTTKTLIIGASMTRLSLNPAFIPHSTNQSMLAESYIYTYTRLKYFLENNPQLDWVVVEFNIPNIAISSDISLSDATNRTFFFSKEFMLLGEDELKILYSSDMIYYRNYLGWKLGFPTKENIPVLFKTFFKNADKESLPFRGSFTDLGEKNFGVGNPQGRIAEIINPNLEPGIAPIQLTYLRKIIDLCKSHNVKIALYASPLSKGYYELIPEFYISEYNRLSNELSNEVDMICNYISYPLSDTEFSDANHLSRAGAEIISRKIAEDIENWKGN
jgi:hypothetical protein